MGFAEVYEWPQIVTLHLEPDDSDPFLTCWLCGRDKTDMTSSWRIDGRRTTVGFHSLCVKAVNAG